MSYKQKRHLSGESSLTWRVKLCCCQEYQCDWRDGGIVFLILFSECFTPMDTIALRTTCILPNPEKEESVSFRDIMLILGKAQIELVLLHFRRFIQSIHTRHAQFVFSSNLHHLFHQIRSRLTCCSAEAHLSLTDAARQKRQK